MRGITSKTTTLRADPIPMLNQDGANPAKAIAAAIVDASIR